MLILFVLVFGNAGCSTRMGHLRSSILLLGARASRASGAHALGARPGAGATTTTSLSPVTVAATDLAVTVVGPALT